MKGESLRSLVQFKNAVMQTDVVEKNHIINHETKKRHKLMAFFLHRQRVNDVHNLVNSAVFKDELGIRILQLQLFVMVFEMFFIRVSEEYLQADLEVVAAAVELEGLEKLAELIWSIFTENQDVEIVLRDERLFLKVDARQFRYLFNHFKLR